MVFSFLLGLGFEHDFPFVGIICRRFFLQGLKDQIPWLLQHKLRNCCSEPWHVQYYLVGLDNASCCPFSSHSSLSSGQWNRHLPCLVLAVVLLRNILQGKMMLNDLILLMVGNQGILDSCEITLVNALGVLLQCTLTSSRCVYQ